jgi:hypothetical protein
MCAIAALMIRLPCRDFADDSVSNVTTTIQALARQDAQLRFCHVESASVLWGVVDFNATARALALSEANASYKLAIPCE